MNNSQDYVTNQSLEYFFKEIIEYVDTSAESVKNELKNELKTELTRLESRLGAQIEKLTQITLGLQTSVHNINQTLKEMKEFNAHMLQMMAHHEKRIGVLENKSHTHPPDML